MTARATVRIGEVIRHARVFNPQYWRGGGVATDRLLQDVDRLFRLLAERRIEYVLVGGIALLQYVQGRNTEDIDLIMALSSLKSLPELKVMSQDKDFARAQFDQLQIDILLTRNRLFDLVRRRYTTTAQSMEREVFCATVEGLLLLKFYALPSLYRQGNFARVSLYENDIATLLNDYNPPLDPLWRELTPHLSPTDMEAVQAIAADIQARIGRFRQGLGGAGPSDPQAGPEEGDV